MQVEVKAIEVFADLLFAFDSEDPSSVFYNRLSEAACRLTNMQRAAVFLYEPALRRVRVIGSHGIDIEEFRNDHVSLDAAPIALQALTEDRVIEATGDFTALIPPALARLLHDTRLVCTPIAAGGHWPGVLISDRPVQPPLSAEEQRMLWSLGKVAALAASARITTREQERAREMQERIDLAREIHDRVIQRLFGVSLALAGEELSVEERRRCGDEIQEALSDLRSAVQRPLGRPSRVVESTLLEELRVLPDEHAELDVRIDAAGVDVPVHLEPLAQSVLAEALRNAIKHADPKCVEVRVARSDGTFVLEVRNDGVAPARRASAPGMGLRLAAVEALQFGGVIEFGRVEPDAWNVRLLVPLEEDAP